MATKAISSIQDVAELRKTFKNLKKLYESTEGIRELVDKGKATYDLASTAKDAGEIASADADEITPEDMVVTWSKTTSTHLPEVGVAPMPQLTQPLGGRPQQTGPTPS